MLTDLLLYLNCFSYVHRISCCFYTLVSLKYVFYLDHHKDLPCGHKKCPPYNICVEGICKCPKYTEDRKDGDRDGKNGGEPENKRTRRMSVNDDNGEGDKEEGKGKGEGEQDKKGGEQGGEGKEGKKGGSDGRPKKVCGSNRKTYMSKEHMRAESCRMRKKVDVEHNGPCKHHSKGNSNFYSLLHFITSLIQFFLFPAYIIYKLFYHISA